MTVGPTFRAGKTTKQIKVWWDNRRADYPFHATSATSVKPTIVDGFHVSCLMSVGQRTWGFQSAADRDRFCMQYGGKAI